MEAERLTSELTDEDRVLLLFAYLGPLAVVSLVASRKEFVKWHAKQGLLLAFAAAALYVLLRAIHLLLLQGPWIVRFLGALFWTLVSPELGWRAPAGASCARWRGSASRCRCWGDLADRL